MRSRILSAVAVIALSTSAAVAYADDKPQSADGQTQKPAKPPKVKKICREIEAPTSSRMAGGRVCRTEEQWAETDAANANLRGSRSIHSFTADTH